LPSTRLESINVSNSGFLGPVALEFNLQYNALIGGRGTGKSSLLEYLRWGLCDQPTGEIDDSELPNFSSAARVSLKTRYDQFKERSKSGSP
jgi:chromosome segregation protein